MYKRKSKGEPEVDMSPAEVPQDVSDSEEDYKTVSYAKKKKTGYSTLVYRVSKDNADIPILTAVFGFVVTLGCLVRNLLHSDKFYAYDLLWIGIFLLIVWLCVILHIHTKPGKFIAKAIFTLDSSVFGRLFRDNKDMILLGGMLLCFFVLGYSLESGRPLRETVDSMIYLVASLMAIFVSIYSQTGEIRKELQRKGNKTPEETDVCGRSVCTDGSEWKNSK